MTICSSSECTVPSSKGCKVSFLLWVAAKCLHLARLAFFPTFWHVGTACLCSFKTSFMKNVEPSQTPWPFSTASQRAADQSLKRAKASLLGVQGGSSADPCSLLLQLYHFILLQWSQNMFVLQDLFSAKLCWLALISMLSHPLLLESWVNYSIICSGIDIRLIFLWFLSYLFHPY